MTGRPDDDGTIADHWFEELADHLGEAYLRYSFTMGTRNDMSDSRPSVDTISTPPRPGDQQAHHDLGPVRADDRAAAALSCGGCGAWTGVGYGVPARRHHSAMTCSPAMRSATTNCPPQSWNSARTQGSRRGWVMTAVSVPARIRRRQASP